MTSQLALFDPCGTAKERPHTRHFHVRHESPAEAVAGENAAAGQERLITKLLLSLPAGSKVTPWDVAGQLNFCINSARRALTNMATRGELIHDFRNRVPAGPYGKRSGTWRLA